MKKKVLVLAAMATAIAVILSEPYFSSVTTIVAMGWAVFFLKHKVRHGLESPVLSDIEQNKEDTPYPYS